MLYTQSPSFHTFLCTNSARQSHTSDRHALDLRQSGWLPCCWNSQQPKLDATSHMFQVTSLSLFI